MRRTRDLRGYAGDGLALLTGRGRAYGYHHVERFLSDLARTSAADPLTDALAAWTTTLWQPVSSAAAAPPPTFYVDGHRKPVYSDRRIPRGLVARRGAVLGCRALTLLHDADGHPLLATTNRGDLHLTAGAPALLARFARTTAASSVRRLVIDREGMAAEFLARLNGDDCDVVTVLRADQYGGLASFTDVGPFVPFQHDQGGTLVREVAPARYALALPDHPGERLNLRVALVRDLRAHVPCPQSPATPHGPYAWLEDLDPTDTAWYREGWTATPAPAMPTEPKLIPIVTTATDVDAAELARAYVDRWPQQENVIKDWLLPLGLDTNHGYAKTPVENSEVSKRRAAVEKRRANAERWAHGARVRYDRATKRYARFWKAARERERALYDEMDRDLWDLQKRGAPEQVYRAEAKARKAAINAEVATILQRAYKAHDAYRAEWDKCERYCGAADALTRTGGPGGARAGDARTRQRQGSGYDRHESGAGEPRDVDAGPLVPGGLRPCDVATPGAVLPAARSGRLWCGHGPRRTAALQRPPAQPRPRRRLRHGPRSAATSPRRAPACVHSRRRIPSRSRCSTTERCVTPCMSIRRSSIRRRQRPAHSGDTTWWPARRSCGPARYSRAPSARTHRCSPSRARL